MTVTSGCPMRASMGTAGLFDEQFIASPGDYTSVLQATAPVHYDAATELWLVSRHADVRTILADPDTFAPDNALDAVVPLRAASLRVLAAAGFSLPHTLANNGGPSHRAYRRAVTAFFSPAAVIHAEHQIRRLSEQAAIEIATGLQDGSAVDLVPLATRDLPARVLLSLLGLDAAPLADLKRWSVAALELFWGNPDRDRQLHLAQETAEFYDWLRSQVRREDNAASSLFGSLADRQDHDGDPISEADVIAICFFLLVAGQETTSQLLAVTLRRLVGEPALWRELGTAEPAERTSLARDCVEEVLRLDSPVTTWRRVTRRSVRLHDIELSAGSQILLMLTASGSDPDAFADPDLLVPGRARGTTHHAFGYGQHFCVGAGLARAEARILVEVLADRLPGLRLIDPVPPQLGLLSFRAPTRLLATVDS